MVELNNLREFSRIEIGLKVEIEREGKDTFKAIAHDVSLNGLCIRSNEHFDKDIACDVKVILGEDNPIVIEASGCPVRSDGEYIAIQFDQLDLEGYSHLKNLILYNTHDSDQVEGEFESHAGIHRKN